MELSTEVDEERVEEEGEAGTEVNTLIAFALDFFFLAENKLQKTKPNPFHLESSLDSHLAYSLPSGRDTPDEL